MIQNKKVLVLITSSYPYGHEETFLETEVNYYRGFKKVFIFPLRSDLHGSARKLPDNVHVIRNNNKCSNKSINMLHLNIIHEIVSMYIRKQLNEKNRTKMLDFYTMATVYADSIYNSLKIEGIGKNEPIIFYSYWLYHHALTAVFLKQKYPNSIAVSRCHGYDIFEERDEGYLPFRKLLLTKLDGIFPIAEMEKSYLKERYPKYAKRIKVSRLGTTIDINPRIIEGNTNEKNVLKIVSCSSIIPLKRVEKIVEVLSKIRDIPIQWIHIGSGNRKSKIEKMCSQLLGKNIKYEFLGQVPNIEVKKLYEKENFHVLIHLSETEGLPVTFMEALSYGIPIIATNVGGVSEIVYNNVNGFLVDKNVNITEVVDAIRKIYTMSKDEYIQYKKQAYTIWGKYYNGNKNYNIFIKDLLKVKKR